MEQLLGIEVIPPINRKEKALQSGFNPVLRKTSSKRAKNSGIKLKEIGQSRLSLSKMPRRDNI